MKKLFSFICILSALSACGLCACHTGQTGSGQSLNDNQPIVEDVQNMEENVTQDSDCNDDCNGDNCGHDTHGAAHNFRGHNKTANDKLPEPPAFLDGDDNNMPPPPMRRHRPQRRPPHGEPAPLPETGDGN